MLTDEGAIAGGVVVVVGELTLQHTIECASMYSE